MSCILSLSLSLSLSLFLSPQLLHTKYQLPAPLLEDSTSEEQLQSMQVFIWALSTIVPLIYMGHKRDESAAQVI